MEALAYPGTIFSPDRQFFPMSDHPTLMTPEAADQGSPVGKACPALAAVDGLCSMVAPTLRQNTRHRNSATPSLVLRDTEKGQEQEQEQGASAACPGLCPSPHVGERILPHPGVSLPSSLFSGLEIQWMAPLELSLRSFITQGTSPEVFSES